MQVGLQDPRLVSKGVPFYKAKLRLFWIPIPDIHRIHWTEVWGKYVHHPLQPQQTNLEWTTINYQSLYRFAFKSCSPFMHWNINDWDRIWWSIPYCTSRNLSWIIHSNHPCSCHCFHSVWNSVSLRWVFPWQIGNISTEVLHAESQWWRGWWGAMTKMRKESDTNLSIKANNGMFQHYQHYQPCLKRCHIYM